MGIHLSPGTQANLHMVGHALDDRGSAPYLVVLQGGTLHSPMCLNSYPYDTGYAVGLSQSHSTGQSL